MKVENTMKLTHTLLGIALSLTAAAPALAAAPQATAGAAMQAPPSTPAVTYRINYTITEMDGTKRIGTQHLAMVLITGGRTTVKQGSKIPIATGSYNNGAGSAAGTQTQFTYLDVGMNIDSSLDDTTGGLRLKCKVEQSGIASTSTIAGVTEPIIRQTVMELSALVTPGKPLILGSLDIPGTTHRLDIEAMIELVK